MANQTGVVILGIFVADTAYFASRLPKIGETLLGSDFTLGPGGKGSNQAVAAGRAGATVSFISKIGNDPFGKMALETYAETGVTSLVEVVDDAPTGAAFVFVNDETGDNAIIVSAGAAGTITVADVEARRSDIEKARVFVTQLEQPAEAALKALQIAREAGVTTVFNPAPANPFDAACFGLTDYFVPNETEASDIVGFDVKTEDDAKRAGEIFVERGVKTALITMGEKGVYIHGQGISKRIPAISNASAIDTTGAGDAFIGGFSTALSEGQEVEAAVRMGCATAGIAVTRRGTAPAMPTRAEIDALLESTK